VEESNEVVVMAYGAQRREAVTGAVTSNNDSISIRIVTITGGETSINERDTERQVFGEKEFQNHCMEKVDKTVCDGKGVTVEVSFFINDIGKPVDIVFEKYTCEEAKKEVENLLSSPPVWTEKNRKVTITIEW
jgi:hypothetical protein